jgi:pimeloyl-ACP methyl ester carboxylesterase
MMLRRHVLQFAAALAAGAVLPLRAQEQQPYEIHEYDFADTARQRHVPVRLYWPREAAERVPLVVFSHGIGGSRRGYSYLGKHFAGNGIASLHLQHVGSDRELWFGNPLSLVGRLQNAAQDSEALDRAKDMRMALDLILAGPWGERIDAQRLIAAGHSYGANTTLLVSGARVARVGGLDLRDERLQAAIVISAPPFYGEGDPGRILQPVQIPTLHITATGDVIRIPGYYSPYEDRVAVYRATGSSKKTLAVFDGGSHSMFTDRPGTGGADLNPQVKAATRELALAFAQAQLGLTAAPPIQEWVTRHRPILAKVEMPGLTLV